MHFIHGAQARPELPPGTPISNMEGRQKYTASASGRTDLLERDDMHERSEHIDGGAAAPPEAMGPPVKKTPAAVARSAQPRINLLLAPDFVFYLLFDACVNSYAPLVDGALAEVDDVEVGVD